MMTSRRVANRHGFTLVELLVVIAIIGILVALLLPAVQAAREAARRSQCANNIKQMCLGVLNYESTNKKLPPGSVAKEAVLNTDYMTNWAVEILPYVEQSQLYDLKDPKQPLHHANNQQMRETIVDSYLCPSDLQETKLLKPASGESGPAGGHKSHDVVWAIGSYRANSGGPFALSSSLGKRSGDTFWDHPNAHVAVDRASQGPMHAVTLIPGAGRSDMKQVTLRKITDGLSNTILVGEYHTTTTEARRTFWAYGYASYTLSSFVPDAATLIPSYEDCRKLKMIDSDEICKRGWGSLHSGGIIQYGFCDGSVTTISDDVDIDLLFAAGSIAGGEPDSVRSR